MAGRCRVVDHREEGAHGILECDFTRPEPRAPPALSLGALCIAIARAQGESLKRIATEHNRSQSSISGTIAQTRSALQLRSDAELVVLFRDASIRSFCAPRGMTESTPWSGGTGRSLLRYPRGAWSSPVPLTAAEREVLGLLIGGSCNQHIAERRHRARRTVANQIRSIYTKHAVTSRLELLAKLWTPTTYDG